ncbi:MAG: NAD+ synthase [Candidatus Omnitrophica bacterium]|jgi:NAD+ synthase (glutamine-hydrolysing)|nr:NAD+ synthase [Candidatus Omnitrophota bacterium]
MKKDNLKIALAQINCTVGDLHGNRDKIISYVRMAEELGADVVSFPELAITGYPAEDLLYKNKFIEDNLKILKEIASRVGNVICIVGFVDKKAGKLYNAAAIIYKGKIIGSYHKMLLPNYSVFDEKRYFSRGQKPVVFKIGKLVFGVNICEDIWHDDGPLKEQVKKGARFIFNINASPYHMGKIKMRKRIICQQAKKNKLPIAYTNLVGAQDELVFDGNSMVVDQNGKIISFASSFKEDFLFVDTQEENQPVGIKAMGEIEEVYSALVLGLKDYVHKNGFSKVVLGLSGGIDSALVLVLAVDALGKDNVKAVFMPSRYSSQESEIDARALCENAGVELLNIPIEHIYKMCLMALEPHFTGMPKNIAEENLQARIRGNMLMALSNKFGYLVVTTGNKSEMSTGYATLYGDMAGGFALIKDVPKVLVYKLAYYRNSLSAVIPDRILTKEPTAELKPNQKDSDTLPVYEELDPVLKAYVEEDRDLEEMIKSGFDAQVASRVISMVDKSEYKRRQSPPGVKITPKAFGRDRRMPITNKYKEGLK